MPRLGSHRLGVVLAGLHPVDKLVYQSVSLIPLRQDWASSTFPRPFVSPRRARDGRFLDVPIDKSAGRLVAFCPPTDQTHFSMEIEISLSLSDLVQVDAGYLSFFSLSSDEICSVNLETLSATSLVLESFKDRCCSSPRRVITRASLSSVMRSFWARLLSISSGRVDFSYIQ